MQDDLTTKRWVDLLTERTHHQQAMMAASGGYTALGEVPSMVGPAVAMGLLVGLSFDASMPWGLTLACVLGAAGIGSWGAVHYIGLRRVLKALCVRHGAEVERYGEEMMRRRSDASRDRTNAVR